MDACAGRAITLKPTTLDSEAKGTHPAQPQTLPPEAVSGVLLLNLGTPRSPETSDVRRYLREFLLDPRVLDVSGPLRWLIVHGAILPFRPQRSAAAYRQIWTERGSPLLEHGRELAQEVGRALGERYAVALGMRYGWPSIPAALAELVARGAESVLVVPLFPQYAGSSTGSALERTYRAAGRLWNVPRLRVLAPYYDDPLYIGALADSAREPLAEFKPDHVLLSYHGLPERQIARSDPGGRACLSAQDCDAAPSAHARFCYRAHCLATSRALSRALELGEGQHTTSFQSRLGRTPWIRPHTDVLLPELAARGVRRLAVLCPSFVADCLETLEEIAIRAREQWRAAGGEELLAVPCLNAQPNWVAALAQRIREQSEAPPPSRLAPAGR
jgi:ferrochelatase